MRYPSRKMALLYIKASFACREGFSISRAMDCHTGGFPSRRHNEIRDITAELISEVCHGISVEPPLQSLNGETFSYQSTNTADDARTNISASGFWGNTYQRAFFDVRVCNPNARTYRNSSISSVYRRHEQEKKRQYDERIRDVEMGTFTPLVFSLFGGMGKVATVTYKRSCFLIGYQAGRLL